MPRGQRRPTRAVTTPVLYPHAAGVDIGATERFVPRPDDRRAGLPVASVSALHVLSNITGVTGLAILDAILAGERDPKWNTRSVRNVGPLSDRPG